MPSQVDTDLAEALKRLEQKQKNSAFDAYSLSLL
jgi:hypothetical protein